MNHAFSAEQRAALSSAVPPQTAEEVGWLLTRFAEEHPGVTHAVVTGADGMLIAAIDKQDSEAAERFAAGASSIFTTLRSLAQEVRAGDIQHNLTVMTDSFAQFMAVNEVTILGVVADASIDMGGVTAAMVRLIDQVGGALAASPRAR